LFPYPDQKGKKHYLVLKKATRPCVVRRSL
jgi:hypothetical protein